MTRACLLANFERGQLWPNTYNTHVFAGHIARLDDTRSYICQQWPIPKSANAPVSRARLFSHKFAGLTHVVRGSES